MWKYDKSEVPLSCTVAGAVQGPWVGPLRGELHLCHFVTWLNGSTA